MNFAKQLGCEFENLDDSVLFSHKLIQRSLETLLSLTETVKEKGITNNFCRNVIEIPLSRSFFD